MSAYTSTTIGAAETTDLMADWGRGTERENELLRRLYPHLRRIAARQLASSDVSLHITDLVQETYLRLCDQRRRSWSCSSHFFAIAARLLRRVMVDHVRRRSSLKRGGTQPRLDLEAAHAVTPSRHPRLLDLDLALEELANEHPTAAQVVELRYFAGCSIEETAAALGLGRSSVVRTWTFARAWLKSTLDDPES